jgi:hypothetical protein
MVGRLRREIVEIFQMIQPEERSNESIQIYFEWIFSGRKMDPSVDTAVI